MRAMPTLISAILLPYYTSELVIRNVILQMLIFSI